MIYCILECQGDIVTDMDEFAKPRFRVRVGVRDKGEEREVVLTCFTKEDDTTLKETGR